MPGSFYKHKLPVKKCILCYLSTESSLSLSSDEECEQYPLKSLIFYPIVFSCFSTCSFRLVAMNPFVFFTFVTVEKQCPYLAKIKVVCKLMWVEHDDWVLRMWKREGTCTSQSVLIIVVLFLRRDEWFNHQTIDDTCIHAKAYWFWYC